ncbi:MAG: DNA topology modulation protein [Acidobacteria bacterium]|nr:DNA topology modulation protein [Acidobacteriota bacterium]
MRRVLVIGSGGAGKSTFARRLGERLGLPVIHLDRAYWRPGWVEPPKDEWRRTVEELCAGEAWVMDGNYSGTLDVRLAACDTVIFLDLPRAVCTWRIVKRSLRYKGTSRPDMGEGCHEQLNKDFLIFLLWVWNYPRRSRPKVLERLGALAESKRIYRLRSSAEAEKFLAEVE